MEDDMRYVITENRNSHFQVALANGLTRNGIPTVIAVFATKAEAQRYDPNFNDNDENDHWDCDNGWQFVA